MQVTTVSYSFSVLVAGAIMATSTSRGATMLVASQQTPSMPSLSPAGTLLQQSQLPLCWWPELNIYAQGESVAVDILQQHPFCSPRILYPAGVNIQLTTKPFTERHRSWQMLWHWGPVTGHSLCLYCRRQEL